VDEFSPKFLEAVILEGLRLDLMEPGRVVFSTKILHTNQCLRDKKKVLNENNTF